MFKLTNDKPRPPKWRGEEPERRRQLKLLEGLDCLPAQQDLFLDQDAARDQGVNHAYRNQDPL